MDARGNPFPRLIDRRFRRVAERVRRTAGIAENLGKIRQHRLDHAGIDSRRGVIVEVDGKLHGRSWGYGCSRSELMLELTNVLISILPSP